jgi:uncharacterized protein (TIGR03546 family)
MFWLQIVSNFIKILREGQTPNQVAGGFALGSIVGLMPGLSLQGLFVWLVIFVLNVNLSAAFLAATLFALVSWLLDPVFHQIGYWLLLDLEGLKGFWTTLYNAPIAPLTRFNNTIVMGSLVGALVLFVPVFFGMKRFVVAYRKTVGARIEKTKLYQIISKNFLVQWYEKVRDLGGLS